jgi:hypothetical protein
LKRTWVGAVTNVEKMARRFVSRSPREREDGQPSAGFLDRRSKLLASSASRSDLTSIYASRASISGSSTAVSVSSTTLLRSSSRISGKSRRKAISISTIANSAPSISSAVSGSRQNRFGSVHLNLPDFPPSAGASARAAVAEMKKNSPAMPASPNDADSPISGFGAVDDKMDIDMVRIDEHHLGYEPADSAIAIFQEDQLIGKSFFFVQHLPLATGAVHRGLVPSRPGVMQLDVGRSKPCPEQCLA